MFVESRRSEYKKAKNIYMHVVSEKERRVWGSMAYRLQKESARYTRYDIQVGNKKAW